MAAPKVETREPKQTATKIAYETKKIVFLDVNGTLQEPGNDSPMDKRKIGSIVKLAEHGAYVVLLTGLEVDPRLNNIFVSQIKDQKPEILEKILLLPMTGTVLQRYDRQTGEFKEVYSTAPKILENDPIVRLEAEAMDDAFGKTGIERDSRSINDRRPTQISWMALGKFPSLKNGASKEEAEAYAKEKEEFEKEKKTWDPDKSRRLALIEVANAYLREHGSDYEGRPGGTTSIDFSLSDKVGAIKYFLNYLKDELGMPYDELVQASVYMGDELDNPSTQEYKVAQIKGLDNVQVNDLEDTDVKLEGMVTAVTLKGRRRDIPTPQ